MLDANIGKFLKPKQVANPEYRTNTMGFFIGRNVNTALCVFCKARPLGPTEKDKIVKMITLDVDWLTL